MPQVDTDLAGEIKRLKREKNAVLLVHNYQRPEVQQVADYLGDSLGLSREASKTEADLIVFCGVSFMAETAKILSPDKKVLVPRPPDEIDCPMAGMITAEDVRELRKEHPDASVVAYVNTTAAVKAEADVCCTSSNAIEVVRNLEAEDVIFVPDRNLASYVSRYVNKNIIPWDGYCYVHDRINPDEVDRAADTMEAAELMVHPECRDRVVDLADSVESTGGMVEKAESSSGETFLVGTEEGLVHRLKRDFPGNDYYTAGKPRVCESMKRTTIEDVEAALADEKYEVELSDEVMEAAGRALGRMIDYG